MRYEVTILLLALSMLFTCSFPLFAQNSIIAIEDPMPFRYTDVAVMYRVNANGTLKEQKT